MGLTVFYHKKSKQFEVAGFFDQLSGFIKRLEEGGMDEDTIKQSLKPLLVRHFQETANIDTTSKKIDRINAQTAKIISGVEDIKTQVNRNLMNMDVANDIATKAKEEAEKFDKNANELASLMAGDKLMMIIILVVVGLLLAVAVFTNLYATIKGPPPKARMMQGGDRGLAGGLGSLGRLQGSPLSQAEDLRQGILRRQLQLKDSNQVMHSKGLFV